MGRRPDPKVQALRKEALRLEQEEGLNAVEIAKIVGRSPAAVRLWLRTERGPKIPVRDSVAAKLAGGMTAQEVAADLGISPAHVWRIQKEERGHLVHPVTSTEDQIDLLLSDPKEYSTARFTRYGSFGRKLIFRIHESVGRDPHGALEAVSTAKELFSVLVKLRRKPELKAVALCQLTQARFAEAARERFLDRPQKGYILLRQALRDRQSSGGCALCVADGRRRQAMILSDLKEFDKALKRLNVAKALYREIDPQGHDLRQDGLASCALVEVQILTDSRAYDPAIRLAQTTLSTISVDEFLYMPLTFTLVRACAESGIRPVGIDLPELLSDLLAKCGSEPSVPRAVTAWLAGKVAENDRDNDGAHKHFEDALYDFQSLQLTWGVGALTADIGGLSLNPTLLKRQVEELQEFNFSRGRKTFPSYLLPIQHNIRECARATRENIREVLKRLRAHSGGDERLPLFFGCVNIDTYPKIAKASG